MGESYHREGVGRDALVRPKLDFGSDLGVSRRCPESVCPHQNQHQLQRRRTGVSAAHGVASRIKSFEDFVRQQPSTLASGESHRRCVPASGSDTIRNRMRESVVAAYPNSWATRSRSTPRFRRKPRKESLFQRCVCTPQAFSSSAFPATYSSSESGEANLTASCSFATLISIECASTPNPM